MCIFYIIDGLVLINLKSFKWFFNRDGSKLDLRFININVFDIYLWLVVFENEVYF